MFNVVKRTRSVLCKLFLAFLLVFCESTSSAVGQGTTNFLEDTLRSGAPSEHAGGTDSPWEVAKSPPPSRPASGGMTSNFFHDFFPALGSFLVTNLPSLWHFLQPTQIVQACPEAAVAVPWLGGLRLRNPHLLPFQLLGTLVGLEGARRLLHRRAAETFYWGQSFLFFGLMNISSILCHALIPHRTLLWGYLAVVDVVMTGCASLCMLYQQMGVWARLPHGVRGWLLPRLLHPPADPAGADALVRCTLAAAMLAGLAGQLLSLKWINEALYLGTTLTAAKAVLLVSWSARHTSTHVQRAYYSVGVAGVVLALAALPADRLLCQLLGPAFGTVHCLFLGCGLGYWGLYGFVQGQPLLFPLPDCRPSKKQA